MAFFGNTFREKITGELERRRNFDGVQDVLVPHVRVTSMVQTPAGGISVNGFSLPAIKGFTLGPHNLVSNTTLDSLSNINNTGCVIGTTYIDGSPKQVVVPTHKNLPSPGVTNVSIEAKGGLMFKATINLKFYGKEQYDAIYQLFMKPGRPIAIEFGHTNTSVKDLDFFTNFDEAITRFAEDLREFKPSIPENPNSGVAVGLVSNFKISLNENNEYEATIDLVNGLEFMFTLPVGETVLDFGEEGLSRSIKENFGMTTGMEYTPKFDCVYKTILDDLEKNPDTYAKDIIWPNPHSNKEIKRSWWPWSGEGTIDGPVVESRPDPRFAGGSTIPVNTNKEMKYVYVGMDYLIGVLLPKILKSTGGGCFEILNLNAEGLVEADIPLIEYGEIGRWELLRSSNIRNVLINNNNLYGPRDTVFINEERAGAGWWERLRSAEYVERLSAPDKFRSRIPDYVKKFDSLDATEVGTFFDVELDWVDKNSYPSAATRRLNVDNEPPDVNGVSRPPPNSLSGIFINYGLVKNSFANANSLSEAIIKILNQINAATSDILKLKLQIVRSNPEDEQSEVEKLLIYDERQVFREETPIEVFTFFQNNKSEAVSYNFDFSLPSAVASTVVANQWKGNDDANDSVGDSEVSHLIRNGYVTGIDTIEQFNPPENNYTSQNDTNKLTCGGAELSEAGEEQTEQEENVNVNDELKKVIEDDELRQIIGYQELVPSGLKSQLIRQGNGSGEKLYDTLPTGAKVTLTLQGLDGFRFGDLFSVENVLPFPYSENALFYLTAYSHNITPDGWTTTINGQYITLTPSSQRENINNSTRVTTRTPSRTNAQEVEFLTPTGGILTDNTIIVNTLPNDQTKDLTDLMLQIVEEVRNRLPEGKIMKVVSGYRSRKRNSEVGGAPNSRHLYGRAVDVNLYIRQPGPSEAYEFIAKPLVRESRNAYTNKCITEYQELNQIFQQVSRDLNIPGGVTWGGLFTDFYDANHFHIDAEGSVT